MAPVPQLCGGVLYQRLTTKNEPMPAGGLTLGETLGLFPR